MPCGASACLTASMSSRPCHVFVLQSYARQSKLVEALNQRTSFKPHLYPRPAASLDTASPFTTPTSTIDQLVQRAEAVGQRDYWTHTAPTNVLLLPTGHATGAIADIMAVDMTDSADGSAPAITLTLDVVHAPRIVNELQQHGKQTLDDDAHYHFFTPAGVTVDAKAFLALLASAGGSMQGEGAPCCVVYGRQLQV